MATDKRIDSPSAISFIETLQGIITRMATNSANCKTWCVTLVAAILALTDIPMSDKLWLCIGIIILMYLLDCYYLGLERHFIQVQNDYVKKIDDPDNMPFVFPEHDICDQLVDLLGGIVSLSTTPFYFIIGIMIYLFINH